VNELTEPLISGSGVHMLGLQVSTAQILVIVVSGVVLVAFFALHRFTPFGLRLRAVAIDPYAAGLMGINVNFTSAVTWGLAGSMAGIAAILIAPLVAFNTSYMDELSVRALAVALVGGLTNLGGAFVAGLIIGVNEAIVAYKTAIPGMPDAAVAALVLVIMLVRPTGLLRSHY